jgi:hypothetical protein
MSTRCSQRVENDRDVDHLLKQGTLNRRDIAKRSGDHAEQRKSDPGMTLSSAIRRERRAI